MSKGNQISKIELFCVRSKKTQASFLSVVLIVHSSKMYLHTLTILIEITGSLHFIQYCLAMCCFPALK